MSISWRAFTLDLLILGLGMSLYAAAMVQAGKLYGTWETPTEVAGLVVCWIALIYFFGGYDTKYLGVGAEEFKRVISAAVTLLAVVSTAAYLLLPESPPVRLVIPSLAVGTIAILIGRWLLRIWLGRQRELGKYQTTTLVVGEAHRSRILTKAFRDDPSAGFSVVAQVEPPHDLARQDGLDAWLTELTRWVEVHGVGAVAIADASRLDPDLLRKLAWKLEGPRVDLLVSPLLHDVAGPRVSVRPASGLPLLHLDEPTLTGPKRFLKRVMDVTLAVRCTCPARASAAADRPGGEGHVARPRPVRQPPGRPGGRGLRVPEVPLHARGGGR